MGGSTSLYGRWSGGPGRAGAELAKGKPLLSPGPLAPAGSASRQHFQFIQSPRQNTDPLGTFLTGCCWQLLVLPQMSLGHCQPLLASSVCLSHTWPPAPHVPLSSVCSGFFPSLVRVNPSSHCHPASPLACHESPGIPGMRVRAETIVRWMRLGLPAVRADWSLGASFPSGARPLPVEWSQAMGWYANLHSPSPPLPEPEGAGGCSGHQLQPCLMCQGKVA